MSRYRTISVKMWGDDKFRRLSRPQPNAQTLWFYLLTGEHTTILPGAFVAGEAALAEALGWPLKDFRKAFTECLDLDLVKVDRETRLVFIPKAVKHNPPQSPNVVKAWRKVFEELPDCPLKETIFNETIASLKAMKYTEAYVEAFGKAFTYAMPESEQEQEQEQEQERRGSGRKRPTPAPNDFKISSEMREFAGSLGVSDVDGATAAMIDHFTANGESKMDWNATWRNWIRNEKKFQRIGFQKPVPTALLYVDRTAQQELSEKINREAAADLERMRAGGKI